MGSDKHSLAMLLIGADQGVRIFVYKSTCMSVYVVSVHVCVVFECVSV